MNSKNIVEIKNPLTGEVIRTLVYTEKGGVRTYKDADTGETVKTLKVCNGGVSDEQIAAWKAAHRRVHVVEVEDGDELLVGYFKRPDMDTMSATNKLSKADEVKGTMTLSNNCWLGGDPIMQTDMVVKMAAVGKLSEIFTNCVGSLKNL